MKARGGVVAVRVPKAESERRWREHYAERRAEIERKRSKDRARVKGAPVLRALDNGREFEFRARLYHAPPVPWGPSLDARDLQERYEALVRDAAEFEEASKKHRLNPDEFPPPDPSLAPDVEEWKAVCREAVRLFKVVFKPVGWRRLFWFFAESPLAHASPAEVGTAIHFFSELRIRDEIDWLIRETAQVHPGTSPPTSTASSPRTPGSANGASPGPRFGRNRGKRSSWGST